ncbi:hypothetical protein [Haloglycomyces albus]|uniref:hypothetical protein n=1 Tax=Haloglycomyces albus TaxID=526067 RepID=UPI00046D1075|nr:hypothetical protein [Haloglycomyces albus]
MTTVLDLPIHALAVHIPIVLVPILLVLGLLYLFIPPVRRRIGWLVATLTLLAPASVFLAIWSGGDLADFLSPSPGEWSDPIQAHSDWGNRLFWVLVGLIPIWWLFATLDRVRRNNLPATSPETPESESEPKETGDPAAKGRKLIMFMLGLITLALILLAGWMLFEVGTRGAEMVWEPKVDS